MKRSATGFILSTLALIQHCRELREEAGKPQDGQTLFYGESDNGGRPIEFFTANKQAETEAAAAAADGRPPLDFDCRELLYQEFPIYMTWNHTYRRWNCRKKGVGSTIGRMYFIGPSGGEIFYLRLLLMVVKGPTSFDDLRTFDGMLGWAIA